MTLDAIFSTIALVASLTWFTWFVVQREVDKESMKKPVPRLLLWFCIVSALVALVFSNRGWF